MIKSMTGYGRAQELVGGRDITVEIKAVNHRFFEFGARVPRAYGYLEEKLKSYIQTRVSRGKIDVGVTILTVEGVSADVEINFELAQAYVQALRGLGERLSLQDDLSLSAVARMNDIFTVRKTTEDEQVIWNAVRVVADEALERFLAMRETEGSRMKEDVLGRLALIQELVAKVEVLSPKTVEDYRARLYARISEVLDEKQLDEQRILTEAALFAEKIAVAEETVRLGSHIHQFKEIVVSGEPMGRKLDFLVQEINREVNTIGSKAQDMEIARIVVDIKSEIEKIREQIQNIE